MTLTFFIIFEGFFCVGGSTGVWLVGWLVGSRRTRKGGMMALKCSPELEYSPRWELRTVFTYLHRHLRIWGCSHCGAAETHLTRNHEVWSLASLSGLRIWRCRELWCSHRHSSDPAFLWLWLWCRPAAVASIWPLVWNFHMLQGRP